MLVMKDGLFEPRVKGQLSEPEKLNGCGQCTRRCLRVHGVTLSLVCGGCLLGVEGLPKGSGDSVEWRKTFEGAM